MTNSQTLSLSNVAEVVGVHPTHLAKMFRRHYGCTIGEYIRMLRLDYAAKLLAQPNKTLSAIALVAGFYDQSHFAHFFKLDWHHSRRLPSGTKKETTSRRAEKQGTPRD